MSMPIAPGLAAAATQGHSLANSAQLAPSAELGLLDHSETDTDNLADHAIVLKSEMQF